MDEEGGDREGGGAGRERSAKSPKAVPWTHPFFAPMFILRWPEKEDSRDFGAPVAPKSNHCPSVANSSIPIEENGWKIVGKSPLPLFLLPSSRRFIRTQMTTTAKRKRREKDVVVVFSPHFQRKGKKKRKREGDRERLVRLCRQSARYSPHDRTRVYATSYSRKEEIHQCTNKIDESTEIALVRWDGWGTVWLVKDIFPSPFPHRSPPKNRGGTRVLVHSPPPSSSSSSSSTQSNPNA